MPSTPTIGVVLALAAAAALSAQQPIFRAGTDYVQLDVVVTDKNDNAIRDLTKDDFEVTEHGRPQTVEDFEFVNIPATSRTVADIGTSAPTIDVVTNAHPPLGRQWVLVIDDLHLIELHLLQTKKVVQEFLEQLSADDQVAIVFVGRSDLSQGFTSDRGAQMRTVGRIRDALGFAPDANDMMSPSQASSPRDLRRYAIATVDVLKNVCDSLVRSTSPRKSLVYVSEGMTYPFEPGSGDPGWVFDQMVEMFGRARQAGVPVYTIDPRGLADCTAVRGQCDMNTGLIANIWRQQQQMRTIAENTGGLAFVGNSDISRAVRELVEDNNSFYLLGYYPQPFDRDGKFHDVKVTVKRPGARVRARAGYEAPKIAAVTSGADTKRALEDALGAALPASGLMLRAFAAPVAPGVRGMKTVVTLEVTYPAPLDGSKLDDEIQFGMLALDGDGKMKASVRRVFHFTGSPQGAPEITYAINDAIDLPSQPLVLRVAIASQTLGKAGAIHVPVEPIRASRDQLQLGAVVVGLEGPARVAAVPAGALKGVVPFQPTTARTFETTDTLRVFVPLFWTSKEDVASVTLSIRSGDRTIVERSGRATGTSDGRGDHRQAPYTDSIPLAGLVAGTYTLDVSARLASGQTTKRDVAIEIR